ncbi:MAG: hypothetical protein IJ274_15160 [Lachnospiraceae bacterium]|nr:hypothetical protein [Lachnospiraceae bacterium]
MFRLWGKLLKENRLINDCVIEIDSNDTRTHKIFHAIDELCLKFDIAHPIWLDSNIRDFKHYDKVRFNADNFIDSYPFDYFEIQIIEED